MITIDLDSPEAELAAAKYLAKTNADWDINVYTQVYAVEGKRVWESDDS